MLKGFEDKIIKLKKLEDKINALSQVKENLRRSIFEIIEKESLDQYKVEGVATVSRVIRKNIKFVKPQEELIEKLKVGGIMKYLEEIPATTKLNAQFIKDAKEGIFTCDYFEVEEVSGPMVRFEKE